MAFPSDSVWASGETGLMSLAIDPKFGTNRRFYTCAGGFAAGGGHDVRVTAWRLSPDGARASRSRVLLTGLPATSGRHGGCRLLITRYGALLVGTGDAAVGENPQRLTSLGGKVLRLNRWSGAPWPKNPWPKARSTNRRYVFTYGHRNVQGLAARADGSLWSVEHGSFRDDEVNRLRGGGNYGWNPVPGYNESVPMTDQSLPGWQIPARWRSGEPTIATSGATWVRGKQWGVYNGTLAVAALAGERVVFMRFDRAGKLRWARAPQALRTHGRLRSITQAPNGDLLVTTSSGSNDAVLRVSPRR
ncbi:PQQ-dependent sugar dehydrogenase [Nocardioides pacificus]